MITANELLECGFILCCDGSTYMYAEDRTNNRDVLDVLALEMYVCLFDTFAHIAFNDITEYPEKRKSIVVYNIEEIKNIISIFDLCIDKYKEVSEQIHKRFPKFQEIYEEPNVRMFKYREPHEQFNHTISILDMVKQ